PEALHPQLLDEEEELEHLPQHLGSSKQLSLELEHIVSLESQPRLESDEQQPEWSLHELESEHGPHPLRTLKPLSQLSLREHFELEESELELLSQDFDEELELFDDFLHLLHIANQPILLIYQKFFSKIPNLMIFHRSSIKENN